MSVIDIKGPNKYISSALLKRYYQITEELSDFRFPLRNKWELCFSELPGDWMKATEIPIHKGG